MSVTEDTPERTAVYRIRGEAGELLYIGMTNSIPVRWNHHMRYQPWWHELRSLTVEFHDTREEAAAAEKAAIKREIPKYNKTYLMRPVPKVRLVAVRNVAPPPPVEPERPQERFLAPDEAAEFLGITLGELAELQHSDSGLIWYDLNNEGRYIRFNSRHLRAFKAAA